MQTQNVAFGEFNSISTFPRVKKMSCPIVMLSLFQVLFCTICRLCLGSCQTVMQKHKNAAFGNEAVDTLLRAHVHVLARPLTGSLYAGCLRICASTKGDIFATHVSVRKGNHIMGTNKQQPYHYLV